MAVTPNESWMSTSTQTERYNIHNNISFHCIVSLLTSEKNAVAYVQLKVKGLHLASIVVTTRNNLYNVTALGMTYSCVSFSSSSASLFNDTLRLLLQSLILWAVTGSILYLCVHCPYVVHSMVFPPSIFSFCPIQCPLPPHQARWWLCPCSCFPTRFNWWHCQWVLHSNTNSRHRSHTGVHESTLFLCSTPVTGI